MNKSHGLFWGIVLIILGVLFLFDELGWVDIGKLWPLLIIALGIKLIIKARSKNNDNNYHRLHLGDEAFISDKNSIIHSNTFGDIKVTINSKDFKGGQVSTVFGDVKVDLSDLNITQGEQTLRLSNSFGDVKISAPKNLAFAIYAANTAGEFKIFDEKRSGWRQTISYKSEGYDSAENRLKVVVNQMFGDLKVW